MTGTIRARETRSVVVDFLTRSGVPKAKYGFRGGELRLLVGEREAVVAVPSGLTFYQLQAVLEKLERLVAEMGHPRDRRQVDIEDCIRGAS